MPTKFIVAYQVATYSGEVTVYADDEERAIAKAKRELRRFGPLPFGYQNFWVKS